MIKVLVYKNEKGELVAKSDWEGVEITLQTNNGELTVPQQRELAWLERECPNNVKITLL